MPVVSACLDRPAGLARGWWRALAFAVLAIPTLVLAQAASPSYQIPRQSIDGGAARATSASYTVHGTIGQPDAGAPMTSASYTLRGGFHVAAALPDLLFSDGFE